MDFWELSTPGDALRAQMDRRGVGVAETARAIGVSRQQLHLMLRGARFTAAQAVRLERIFDVPASQWMALQVDCDLAEARDPPRAGLGAWTAFLALSSGTACAFTGYGSSRFVPGARRNSPCQQRRR